MMRYRLILGAVLSALLVAGSEVVVQLPLGRIAGTELTIQSGRRILSFEGVPYAEAPVGSNRFKEPLPLKPWPGTWVARTKHICIQMRQFYAVGENPIAGNEDCLYVNIYTPRLNGNFEVIVGIHGGAFMFGSGARLIPDFLLNKDVVLVNINYRVGPLGFLSTEDSTVPGNNGLRDQNMAFQWIQKNIRYFGGNPRSVTIQGLSAGAASVHLHYLIPKSAGLFHRGISQSGCALNSWVLMEAGREKAKKLGNLQGCPTDNLKVMVDCLRTRPARSIVQAVNDFQPWRYSPFSPFGVVVDKWSHDPLLPDHPYNLIKSKRVLDVPWLISFTNSEGLYPAEDFYDDALLSQLDLQWNEFGPFLLDYNYTVAPSDRDKVSQLTRKVYLKDNHINKTTFMDLVRLLSNRHFWLDIEKAARLHAAVTTSPVYSYYFTYRGADSAFHEVGDFGAAHGDDTTYILGIFFNPTTTPGDSQMTDLMVKLVTTFAKNGTPNINVPWRALSRRIKDPYYYVRIDNATKITPRETNMLGDRPFWEKLPIVENEKLFFVLNED